MNVKVQDYLKAIFGAVGGGLGAIQVANSDGHITNNEWITVAIVVLGLLGVIWGVPNTNSKGTSKVV